jgi:hypothetical protein
MNLKLGGDGGWHENAKKTHHLKLTEDLIYRQNYSKKISESNKNQYVGGRRERNYFYDWSGKKHSEETKNKMSDLRKGTGIGEKNSVYGRKWINKEGEKPKMVKKEEIEVYLNNNWKLGKTPK